VGSCLDKTHGDPNDAIKQLSGDHRRALATFFDRHREGLRRMVELRLDTRIRARLDASRIVQAEFLAVAREPDERSCIVDTLFAPARLPRGKPPGKVRLGIMR
jgi:hypothetical protein